jgi:DNA-binding CsgD family transcriptional regulator
LAAIDRLLDAPEQIPRVAVLPGEAGIGKTALWLAGINAAASRGYRIMSSRPSEAETRFSFAGLADLLGGVAGDVLPKLPPIQGRALEAALLLGEESEIHADDRVVAAAFLGALRYLAHSGPLCVAVDDVQWLDAASVAAVRYALARLEREQVATLLAVRGGVPQWLGRTVPEGRLHTIQIGRLSVGALRELLLARLDVAFPRPTLIRLWQASGGNPFFALELASALHRRGGVVAPGDDLPLPSDLNEVLQDRLAGISSAALALARAVAALADPTLPLVEAAVGRHADAGLAEVLAARIIELDGERLRFTHPLLGSAVAARQTPSRRRLLHARLVTLVPTAEERARHLALATAEPSGEVASVLEDAARSAQARGALAAAAELAEQAVRLTPSGDGEDMRRRLILAADRHYAAGDTDRAVAMLDQAGAAAAPGVERATVLARLAYLQPNPRDSIALYRTALAETDGDDALQAEIHMNLASLMRFADGRQRGLEHGELAVRAAERVGNSALRCRALAAYGMLYFGAGHGIPMGQMEAALALERSLAEWPLTEGPAWVFGHQLWWSADVDRARALFQEIQRVASARNDPDLDVRWFLSYIEWRAGNWDKAERYAAEYLELSSQYGRMRVQDELPSVIVAAHLGQIVEARARAQRAIARAEAEGNRNAEAGYGWVLGFIELSVGDSAAALERLRRTYEVRNAMFVDEPGVRLELGDLIEALISAGNLDEANEVLLDWEPRAVALDRSWALAILARGRALLLAARGDLNGAFASFDRALLEHARCGTDPFHHARTLLALGKTQRRAKQRGLARTTLDGALAHFERVGAPLWAEQTRAELARIGGRAPSSGELTESERRIARLVAEGRTNREIAAALFLTEHSVETALTRVYQKLGVRSRAGLAHRLATNSQGSSQESAPPGIAKT